MTEKTMPKRTEQYRTTKTGVVRVYFGAYDMPPHVLVAYACGEGAKVTANHAGQEAFAVRPKAEAVANAAGTIAYACADRSVAHATVKGSTAIAMHSDSKSYSYRKAALAVATFEGARAYIRDGGGEVQDSPIQDIFPNNSRELEMSFT